ncbi:MAG TPA: hypothetical protein VFS21_28600 [Roseiflexaceae bacterium]|nr:hypothetical protein [Roseiflexaceae bacterium]
MSRWPDVPAQATAQVKALLKQGEQLRRVMQPAPARIRRDASGVVGIGVVVFGICLLVALFIVWDEPVGAVFVLGLGALLAFPFGAAGWSQLRRGGEHVYAITDRRLIIIQPASLSPGTETHSYGRRDISQLRVREQPDGSGDLLFSKEQRSRGTVDVGFLGVADVAGVRRLILDTFGFAPDDFQER